MSDKKQQIHFLGQDYEAVAVAVEKADDHANRYTLADGAVVELRLVLVDVKRLVGAKDADGKPVYLLKSHTLASVAQAT